MSIRFERFDAWPPLAIKVRVDMLSCHTVMGLTLFPCTFRKAFRDIFSPEHSEAAIKSASVEDLATIFYL